MRPKVDTNQHQSSPSYERSQRLRQFGLVLMVIVPIGLMSLAASQLRVRPTLGQPRLDHANDQADSRLPEPLGVNPVLMEDAAARHVGPPQLVCDVTIHDFGKMDPHSIAEHRFIVHNSGSGPLKLLDHRSTCQCTVGRFSRQPIAPGDTADIVVQWQTDKNNRRFEQSATILTNDPQQPELTLTVCGDVMVHLGANPPELSFPKLRPDEGKTASTLVSSQVWTDFRLQNIQSSMPGLRWNIEPVDDDELRTVNATSAQRLEVQLPGDIPVGHFTHWIRFEVVPDSAEAEPREYEIPIRGKVLRRLAVYGQGIDNLGNLNLGVIDAQQGLTRKLILKVYDQQPELSVEMISVTPGFVHVQVVPMDSTSADKGLYALEVQIPQESPVCQHLGEASGEIDIRFAHPRIDRLQLKLQLAVTQRLALAK